MSIWTINGYPMSNAARNISDRAGWERSATSVGQADLSVHNRPGVLWAPKHPSTTSFSLNFWLAGDTEAECWESWENLLRAVYSVGRLATIRRESPDGDVRVCSAELSAAIEPTWVGRTGMKGTLRFTVPSGAWLSESVYTYNTTSGSSLPKRLELPDLAKSTTQIRSIVMSVRGPITNPVIVNASSSSRGEAASYAGVIPANARLVLDSRMWSVRAHDFTPNREAVVTTGPALMSLDPVMPGNVHVLELRGAGGGSTTQLSVEASAAFS